MRKLQYGTRNPFTRVCLWIPRCLKTKNKAIKVKSEGRPFIRDTSTMGKKMASLDILKKRCVFVKLVDGTILIL
jgi:hypothetical protein